MCTHYIWHPATNKSDPLNCWYDSLIWKGLSLSVDRKMYKRLLAGYHLQPIWPIVMLQDLSYTLPIHLQFFQWTCPTETPNISCSKSHIHFLLPRSFQRICPNLRPCVTYYRKLAFYGEKLLAHHPTSKLENHPLSTAHDCLFNIIIATLHIWKSSPPWYFNLLAINNTNMVTAHIPEVGATWTPLLEFWRRIPEFCVVRVHQKRICICLKPNIL